MRVVTPSPKLLVPSVASLPPSALVLTVDQGILLGHLDFPSGFSEYLESST